MPGCFILSSPEYRSFSTLNLFLYTSLQNPVHKEPDFGFSETGYQDITGLFHTDLHEYAETILSQRDDIQLDKQVWERIENIYTYYRNPDILGNGFIYLS